MSNAILGVSRMLDVWKRDLRKYAYRRIVMESAVSIPAVTLAPVESTTFDVQTPTRQPDSAKQLVSKSEIVIGPPKP